MLFCETHDLVWEIIRVSEKRMKNCIVKITKIIDNVFEKKGRRWVISFNANCNVVCCLPQLPHGVIHITWVADALEDAVGGGSDGGLELLGLHLAHAEGAVIAVGGRVSQNRRQLRLL